MAWRDPIFCFENLLRVADTVTPTPAEDASYPVTRCYDDLLVPYFTYGSSTASPQVSLDRGSPINGSTPDRLIVGPNWDHGAGVTIQVHEDDNSGYSSATLLVTQALSGLDETEPISLALAASADERYIRWRMTGTCNPVYREVWLTQDRVPAAGADPNYVSVRQGNIVETEMESGATYRTSRGDPRQFKEYTFRYCDAADVAIFDDLETVTENGLHPFWFFPPDDGADPILVELVGDIGRRQASSAPRGTGEYWDITIRMLERLV